MKLETSRRWGTTTLRRDFTATAADETFPDVADDTPGSGVSYRFSTIGSIMLWGLKRGWLGMEFKAQR